MIDEKSMTLLQGWQGQSVQGWLASEKLHGVRSVFDGRWLWTRQGNVVPAPADWLAQLPCGIALDGELWAGRDGFEEARKAAQYGGTHWTTNIRYGVFDCPSVRGTWGQRMAVARAALRGCPVAFAVSSWRIQSTQQMLADLRKTQAAGGEGLVLRNPSCRRYESGRTPSSLKLKAV